MKVEGKHYRTIWQHPANLEVIHIIDQRKLPFKFVIQDLKSFNDAVVAIRDMHVRGAGLIGATAGYGMYLAALEASTNSFLSDLDRSARELIATRPTAVNLKWAVDRQLSQLKESCRTKQDCIETTLKIARTIADEDAEMCRAIGAHGLPLLKQLNQAKKGKTVNILTHCNAGWLAFVDYGSATAPIYEAHNAGMDIHVWVDETRPRNQGARLTAWELAQHGVKHTVIPDNTGGHLMQQGLVDIVISGADRVTRRGDAANKIGTYLKALAAKDNNIPFYVALPSSTFDWNIEDGMREIPIEERDAHEVRYMAGWKDGEEQEVLIVPEHSPAANYGFDVTPARLITGLITEKGTCAADATSISRLFGDP